MALFTRLIALAAALLIIGAGTTLATTAGVFDGDGVRPQRAVVSQESPTDGIIAGLQQLLQRGPESVDTLSQLASAYLQKGRETGDPTYYARADRVLQQAIAIAPNDTQVLAGMSALALARHDFAGALALARRLPQDRAGTQGLLGDALVELGRYDEAFAAFQRMADIRPDSAALARAAHARELTGDRAGAIEAMTEAAEAAGMRGDSAAWLRIQLGHLYFGGGDLEAAEDQYNDALSAFPRYIHALAGLGRVNAARRDFAEAIDLYRDVVDRYPVPEYVIALGDVYAASGQTALAARQYALVEAIDTLFQENGVITDLDLALFFADHKENSAETLRRARETYQEQPSIHAADVLSWVLFKAGHTDEARDYSREALRLGTQDALMLFHAGMIAREAGDFEGARSLLSRALDINPSFSLLHADEASAALAQAYNRALMEHMF